MSTHPRLPRVAVVERFRLVADTLDLVLSSCCDTIPVPVQSLYSTEEVRRAVRRRRPDAAVVGMRLGGSIDPLTLVADLVADGCAVVALADHGVARTRLRWAGATVLCPDAGVDRVRSAILRATAARSGPPPTPSSPAPALATVPVSSAAPVPDPRRVLLRRLDSLSRREVDVLALLVRGRTSADVARAHVVSELTVRTQVKSILRKLGVETQLAAVAVALRAGWEPPIPEAA